MKKSGWGVALCLVVILGVASPAPVLGDVLGGCDGNHTLELPPPPDDDGGDGGGGGGGTGGGGESTPSTEDGSEAPPEQVTPQTDGETAADPVQLPSGQLVTCVTDLSIPGRGIDFEWRRCYRSSFGPRQMAQHTLMGANWFLNYDQRYTVLPVALGYWDVGHSLLWHNGQGGVVEFVPDQESTYVAGNYSWHSEETGAVLTANAGGGGIYWGIANVKINTPDGLTYVFGEEGDPISNTLKKIVDRNGNEITISWILSPYLNPIILNVTDTMGRVFTPEYASIGGWYVVSAVGDDSGRQVDYLYVTQDSGPRGKKGDLKEVQFPEITGTSTNNDFSTVGGNRKNTRYAYAHGWVVENGELVYPDGLAHQLIRAEDPEGEYLRNWYGGGGTVINSPGANFPFHVPKRLVAQVWGNQTFVDDPNSPDYPRNFCLDPVNMNPSVVPPGEFYCFQYEHIALHKTCEDWREHMDAGAPLYPTRAECETALDDRIALFGITGITWEARKMVARVVTVREKDRNGNVKVHRYDLDTHNTPVRTHTITAAADPALIHAAYDPWTPEIDPLSDQPGVYTEEYEYNRKGLLIHQESPLGRTTDVVYDTAAADPLFWNVPREVWENGVLLQKNFYEDPRFPLPTRIQAPKPDHPTDMVETNITYDANGNVLTRTLPPITQPDGSVLPRSESYTYNAYGQLQTSLDAEGNSSLREYYPVCGPGGPGTSCGTGEGGYLWRMTADATDSTGRNQDFDTAPSPPAVSAVVEFEYDTLGNATRIIDPRGVETIREYNQHSQLVSETVDPIGIAAQRRLIYNGNGVVVQADVLDAYQGASRWVSTINTYDLLNTLLTRTQGQVVGDPAEPGVTTRFIYDVERRLVGVVNPAGEAISFSMDERGLVTSTTAGCTFDGTQIICGSGTVTAYSVFDDDGRKIEDRSALSISTHYDYDQRGRLLRILAPNGSGIVNEYDRASRLIASNSYDKASGTLVAPGQISFPGGLLARSEADHDEAGAALRTRVFDSVDLINPLSQAEAYMDRLGRVTKRIGPTGAIGLTRYDGLGRPVWQQAPSGTEGTVVYDAVGNVLNRTLYLLAQETDFSLPADNVGLAIETQTLITYDNLNRPKTVTDHLGAMSEVFYDSRGIARRTVDALGNVSMVDVDALGRAIRTAAEMRQGGTGAGTYLDEIETLFEFDAASRLTKQWDHLGRLTEYEYDALGRRTKRHYAGVAGDIPRTAQYFYDADGRMVASIDDRGYCQEQIFDAMGQIITARAYESCAVTGGQVTDFLRGNLKGTFEQQFDYDGFGRLIWHTDDNGDLAVSGALQYDIRGLVLNETLDVAQPSGTGVMSRTVSHEYDAAGMVKKMTYPGASQTGGLDYEVGRDSAGRLLDLTLTANAISQQLAAYRYEGRQVTGREVYNPASGAAVAALTRTYDGMRRSLTRQETATSGGAAFLVRERRYDPMGNVTLAYDAVRDVGEVFRYDSLYRMTSTRWDVPNDGSQLLSLPNHQSLNAGYEGLISNPVISGRKDYTLDAVGNWENVDETLPGTPLQSIDYAFNNFNEITTRNGDSFVYGASGNIQEEPTVHSPDGRFYYEYDFANRLIRACSGGPCVGNDATTIARYYYDALGRRVRKVLVQSGTDDVTDYVLSGAQIIEERKVLSGGTDELKRRFFYRDAVNGLVGMDDFDAAGNSQRYYFHRDEQGSVVAVTRGDGAAWDGSNHARTLRYGAYGQLLADSDPGSAVEVPFRYTGHYFDQETGLYYMRARYYRPAMGRFLSRDPLGYVDGMNLYAYVGNSPATFVDPFGTDKETKPERCTGSCKAKWEAWADAGINGADIFQATDAGNAAELAAGWKSGVIGRLTAELAAEPDQSKKDEIRGEIRTVLGGADLSAGKNVSVTTQEYYWPGLHELGGGGKDVPNLLAGATIAVADPSQVGKIVLAALMTALVIEKAIEVIRGPPDVESLYFHYTDAEAGEGIQHDQQIRPSGDGFVYVTPTLYLSAAQAQKQLEMINRPDGFFMIPSDRLTALGPLVKNSHGGFERANLGPVSTTGLLYIPMGP